MPTLNPHLLQAARLAADLRELRTKKQPEFKAALMRHFQDNNWFCSSKFRVPSRGSNDHFRGVLDLVAWPPPSSKPDRPSTLYPNDSFLKPNRSIINRDHPVIIEIDKTEVRFKTRAKLQSFQYNTSGKLVLLTNAIASAPYQDIDLILCLGA